MRYTIVDSVTGKPHFSTSSEWIANEIFKSYVTGLHRYRLVESLR